MDALEELLPGNLGITVGIQQGNQPVDIILSGVGVPEIDQEHSDFSVAQVSTLVSIVSGKQEVDLLGFCVVSE